MTCHRITIYFEPSTFQRIQTRTGNNTYDLTQVTTTRLSMLKPDQYGKPGAAPYFTRQNSITRNINLPTWLTSDNPTKEHRQAPSGSNLNLFSSSSIIHGVFPSSCHVTISPSKLSRLAPLNSSEEWTEKLTGTNIKFIYSTIWKFLGRSILGLLHFSPLTILIIFTPLT